MKEKMQVLFKKSLSAFLALLMIAAIVPYNAIPAEAVSNEQTIYNFCINELGVNVASACGIIANIKNESNFNPTASCIDTNGKTSYGICQWNGSRFTNLKNWCNKNGYSYSSLTAQLKFLKYELNGSEKSAFNKIKGVSNLSSGAYNAGYNWAKYFERCVSSQYDKRGKLARDTYWKKYGNDVVPLKTNEYTYDADAAVAYAAKHWNDGKGLCAEFVSDCIRAGGFTKVYNVNAKKLGQELQKYGTKLNYNNYTPGDYFYANKFSGTLSKGDIIVWENKSGSSASGHVMLYSGCNDSKGRILVYAHNNAKNKKIATIGSRADKVYAIHLSGKSLNYTLSGNDIPDSRTNTTNVITSTLSSTANVQAWGYYVGTSKSDVSAHRDLGNETSKYVPVKAYTKSGTSMKTLSTTVNNLKPNKTYWYVIDAKIGDKWYFSNAFYGATTNIAPHSTELKAAGGSADIGINDTATLTWNTAKLADTYTVKLYDSSEKEVFSKTGIQGTSFAFPASCFTKAGTFTAKLWAVNAAGSTEAMGNPTITVHNNVNVTFYDTVSNTDIITRSVTYGHDATPPENPSQTGYTFVGWNGNYSKVTADTTVKANFEANKYTVKFVDSMTGNFAKYWFNIALSLVESLLSLSRSIAINWNSSASIFLRIH